MLSILVCHSYYLRLDHKQVLRAKPYPPLATLQVVAMLREAGHRVSFFDAMVAEGIDEYECLLQAERPQLVLFYEDNFNFLSKMCLGAMRRAACDMVASARRVRARVIVAGPDVTDAPGPYLDAGADLALVGEGLSTLFTVLPRLDACPDADNASLVRGVSGVVSLSSGKALTPSGSRSMPIVTDVGIAAWELVDMDRYRAMWLKAHGYFSLNMAASRGCPFRCAWCAKPIWGNQYLQRNATEVAEEMAYLKRSFNPDHIWFADDIFGFRVDWVAEFAASVRRSNSFHHTNARGPGQRTHGRGAARCRMPGSMDRRRERQPTGVGCDEQGHHGSRDQDRARSAQGRRYSRRILHSTGLHG